MSVCVRERECVSVCVCVCVRERDFRISHNPKKKKVTPIFSCKLKSNAFLY